MHINNFYHNFLTVKDTRFDVSYNISSVIITSKYSFQKLSGSWINFCTELKKNLLC